MCATSSAREPWYAGVTWKGLAVIGLLCLINALRRLSNSVFDQSLLESTLATAESFGTGLIVALLIMVAVVFTYNRVSSTSKLRYPALALAIVLASALGVAILLLLEPDNPLNPSDPSWAVDFLTTWPRYALPGLLLAGIYVYLRDSERSAAAANAVELDRVRLDRQMEEARLQVLQAQIEPHFLFNTLATVRRLYQTEPAAAADMLDNLMRYLAVALPQMRATESTLVREASLAEAYLNIQQIRMGRRLAFAIEIPDALGNAQFPPVMLLTLVENAIKHGIDPLPEGGFIRISADIESAHLQVQVADSGQGFSKSSGVGTGLANTRARLAAMYGGEARLSLGLNRPRGVTATLRVPYIIVSAFGAAA
jgi:sensor histidine kinase YesM